MTVHEGGFLHTIYNGSNACLYQMTGPGNPSGFEYLLIGRGENESKKDEASNKYSKENLEGDDSIEYNGNSQEK